MEDQLWAFVNYFQMLKTLPQNEYRNVGEFMLPKAFEINKKLQTYKSDYEKEVIEKWEKKFYDIIKDKAENGVYTVFEDDNFQYSMHITKEQKTQSEKP